MIFLFKDIPRFGVLASGGSVLQLLGLVPGSIPCFMSGNVR